MVGFVRRHSQPLDRWSSTILFLGLGHLWLGRFGDTGIFAAMALVFVAACFRTLLFEVIRRPAG